MLRRNNHGKCLKVYTWWAVMESRDLVSIFASLGLGLEGFKSRLGLEGFRFRDFEYCKGIFY